MPTAAGPNTKGEENLVFGYDLGDIRNSYKGEPTENLLDGGASRATAVTGVWSHGNHAGANSGQYTNVDFSSTYPKRKNVIRVVTTNDTDYGMINQRMSTNAISGSTYTYSFDYKQIRYDGTWVPTAGVYGDGYKVPNSSYTNANTTYQYIPLSDGWTRFVMTYDATYTGRNTFRSNMNTNDTADFEILFDNFQIEGKSHATPFTAGTRSATEGLKDLTGNSTIDLTNVSFDSDAQMTFDGSSDHIAITGNILNVNSFTVEAVVNITSVGNYNKPIFVAGDLSSAGIWFFKHRSGLGNRLVMHGYDGINPRIDVDSVNTIPDAENTYVAVTFDGNAYQLYMNGEPEDSPVVDNKVGATTTNYIGKQGGTYLDGDIPMMKIYTRGLSASEIKSNFNAIKGRFNI